MFWGNFILTVCVTVSKVKNIFKYNYNLGYLENILEGLNYFISPQDVGFTKIKEYLN